MNGEKIYKFASWGDHDMKMRSLFAIFIVLSILLAGCRKEEGSANATRPPDVEPTAVYDWMAGESPVPNRRMGIVRFGVNTVPHAVSPNGVYFRVAERGKAPYIMYMDHGSDTIIPLCGRPDCSHDDPDCNAYVDGGSQLTYYDGYLYVMSGDGSEEKAELLRMDPDGSNRVAVLDLLAFAKKNGGDYIHCDMISNGICFLRTCHWVEYDTGDSNSTGIKGESLNYYIYRLDGSMDAPVLMKPGTWVLYNCGDVMLAYSSLEAKNGGEYGSLWSWDPDKDERTYLTDHPGSTGYFDDEAGYYFKNGTICRLTYATQTEEVFVDTGLAGNYVLLSFPECMVLASREDDPDADDNLYFYNWAFELVDTVKIEFPHSVQTEWMIIAETAERIILSNGSDTFPRYYIDKSELGSGNVKVHSFQTPY